MYSYRSDYSDRRPPSDRNPRRWNDCDDRDSYNRHDGDRHSRTEKTSRSKEYSDSPKRMYSKDSLDRDWARKSPVRRHVSSPDGTSSERKRQRFTEDYEDDYRHRRDPEDKTYRLSPEGFPRLSASKDFKHTLPQEEIRDLRYTKPPNESRQRQIHEEFTYRKQCDVYRSSSPYHKERDCNERSWDCSLERTQSQDRSNKSHFKPREGDGDPCADSEKPRRSTTRFLSREQSFSSDVTNQPPAVPGQRPTNGFQRFLDVLNKGVNVAMLTKIVTQTSKEMDRPCSPASFAPWPPVSAVEQQGSNQISEREGSQRPARPRPDHRSSSPRLCSVSERPLQTCDGGQSCPSSKCRSESPVAEKVTLTPEDEHQHRQMQDVLQAIGMDLGFEEVGQMSHRIKERLYGKRGDDWSPHHTAGTETDTRRTSSLSRPSGSSRRSDTSPLAQDHPMNKDCYGAQTDVTERGHAQLRRNSSSSSVEHGDTCEPTPQQSSAALQTFSQTPVYTVPDAPAVPYPPMAPVCPPNLPHSISRLLLPHLPPVPTYPHISPLNIFPAVLPPTRHPLPQHIDNPSMFSLPPVGSAQPLSAVQKSKTPSRPRCLQVIETKQPG